MLLPLIKKVGKPLIRSLIISNISLLIYKFSYSQQPHAFNDSILLRRELDSVLAKHGLKTKGFVINVISLDQRGGQTAYSITNNYYYGDTTSDVTNFGCDTITEGGKKWVYVYPKKGVWQNPFIGLDTLTFRDYIFDPGIGTVVTVPGFSVLLPNDTVNHGVFITIPSGVCSRNTPLRVAVLKENGFFIFGDFTDFDKFYLYSKGKGIYFPATKTKQ